MDNFTVYMWPLINLVVLVYLFFRYAREPLVNYVSNYRQEVDDSLERAEADRTQAEDQLDSWRRRWETIDGEIDTVMERARETARRRREQLDREAEAEREHRQNRVEESLRRDREKVVQSLRADAARILVDSTAATLREVVTEDDQERLLVAFTRELEDVR